MESVNPKDEQTREVEAESVSYSVCQYYNIETSANSLGYIAHWSSGKELPELKASLETISKTANYLITEIDRHFAEVCKERGIVLEQAESSDGNFDYVVYHSGVRGCAASDVSGAPYFYGHSL